MIEGIDLIIFVVIFKTNIYKFLFFLLQVEKALKCCTSEKYLSLGKGCMGTTVYVGIMEDGSEVAVKRSLTQACEDSAGAWK